MVTCTVVNLLAMYIIMYNYTVGVHVNVYISNGWFPLGLP